MKNKFTIGEMAKLHKTTIKTLRYYDEINLFKPIYTDPQSGYRYYSTEQFEQLNTINYLKELGFSLKEIQEHFDTRDIEKFLLLLEEQRHLTKKKIEKLEKINDRFQRRINDIKFAQNIKNLNVPFVKEIEERNIVEVTEKIKTEHELEIYLRYLESTSNMSASIFVGGVGLTVEKNNIQNYKFDEYNSIFILVEDDEVSNSLVTIFPRGMYACIYYNGNHSESTNTYILLLNYIKENGYEIIGDSIERTIINHYVSGNKEDYLTEIQIPIKY